MAIEQTMAQLAHSQVMQAMPSLANSIQGFQLIDSSEDDSSAVGVLVALIGDTCIYIPAIYKHGHIYNMDIMYVPEMSQWLPTQDNWVTYLKSKKPELLSVLRLRDSTVGSNKPGAVDLNLPFRQLVKAASSNETDRQRIARLGIPAILKEAADVIVNEIDKGITKPEIPSAVDVLHKCAAESTAKFLNSIIENTALSNAFVQYYSDKELMDLANQLAKPVEGKITGTKVPEKKGSVRILTAASNEAKDLTEEEKKELLLKGAVIVDDRGLIPSKLFKIKNTGDWKDVTSTGIYELLKDDGSTLTAFVYSANGLSLERVADTCDRPVGQAYPISVLPSNVGTPVVQALSNPDNDYKTFLICAPNGNAIPISASSVSVVSGRDGAFSIKGYIKVNDYTTDDPSKGFRDVDSIELLPKSAQIRISNGILYIPDESVAIRVENYSGKSNALKLATTAEVCNALQRRENLLGVKISNSHYMFTVSDDNNRVTEPLGKQAAAMDLVKTYAIPVNVAQKVMEEASEKPVSTNRYLVKIAADTSYQLMFDEKMAEVPQEEMVDLDQKLPEDAVQTLIDASNTGVKEIMDVTVLKTLAKDTSSVRQIQELVPRLFSALDAVARILFMIRAGDSMTDAYGASRADDMEDQFSQLVDGLGDAIICLQRGRIDSIHDLLEGPLASTLG